MPYIVKSSLDLGGKIIPWNEQMTQKMIKDKKEYFAKKEKEEKEEKEVKKEKEEVKKENEQNNEQSNKKNKKEQKVGEK